MNITKISMLVKPPVQVVAALKAWMKSKKYSAVVLPHDWMLDGKGIPDDLQLMLKEFEQSSMHADAARGRAEGIAPGWSKLSEFEMPEAVSEPKALRQTSASNPHPAQTQPESWTDVGSFRICTTKFSADQGFVVACELQAAKTTEHDLLRFVEDSGSAPTQTAYAVMVRRSTQVPVEALQLDYLPPDRGTGDMSLPSVSAASLRVERLPQEIKTALRPANPTSPVRLDMPAKLSSTPKQTTRAEPYAIGISKLSDFEFGRPLSKLRVPTSAVRH